MKKLQNNFTTPEQSKRLLELGVPADSADCYWRKDKHENLGYVSIIPSGGKLDEMDVPCWSVGRLIEIWCLLGGKDGCFTIHHGDNAIKELVDAFEYFHLQMDFSKLED